MKIYLSFIALIIVCSCLSAEPPSPRIITEPWKTYFEGQVSAIEGQLEREVKSREDWLAKKGEYRRQLAEMLGLDPLPLRTDLKAEKTGEFEQDGVIVEKLNYQSLPGLYVTANLYRPTHADKPMPAILYGCGHSSAVKDGISFGNKSGYEHHGMWYAKHGFVCLVYDTVQLGEIHGEHHGTYSKGRWWWYARGYTPAGLEAWSGMRGLDYLETRPEVDKSRLGVAGRSGGGAYSWWVAALDDRVKASAPTAGITTLRNHVIDGCVAGHCDCMYLVNTYRWDYDKVTALVAPRALLVSNTDKDDIFPIDGVFKIYQSTRRIYKLLGAENNIGMQFAEGPHKDTQPLNIGEFHWMTRILQGADPLSTLDTPAVKSIAMEKLRVFGTLPADERNTRIDESFVAPAKTQTIPADQQEWNTRSDGLLKALREKCFAGQFTNGAVKQLESLECSRESSIENAGLRMEVYRLKRTTAKDPESTLMLNFFYSANLKLEEIGEFRLKVLDDTCWGEGDGAMIPSGKEINQEKERLRNSKSCTVYFVPRGVGPLYKVTDLKVRTHLLRRFYLIGETLESVQMWDIRCAIRALQNMGGLKTGNLRIQASGVQAVNTIYASLFENDISSLELFQVPLSHADGPVYLNVLKYIDIPQAIALAAGRTRVSSDINFDFASKVSERLGWLNSTNKGIINRN